MGRGGRFNHRSGTRDPARGRPLDLARGKPRCLDCRRRRSRSPEGAKRNSRETQSKQQPSSKHHHPAMTRGRWWFGRERLGDDGFRLLQAKAAAALLETPWDTAAARGAIPHEMFGTIHEARSEGVPDLSAGVARACNHEAHQDREEFFGKSVDVDSLASQLQIDAENGHPARVVLLVERELASPVGSVGLARCG